MNKPLLFLILYTLAVQMLSILLTLLKSRLSDVTEVTVSNMLNPRWLWSYRWYAVGVFIIAIPWIIGTFMTAQLAKEFSQGTQTAVVATLAGSLVAAFLGFIQFFVFQVVRAEAIPPLGLNRIWINIGLMACLSVTASYLAFDTMTRLRLS